MTDIDKSIRKNTLEALAKSFHEEGRRYGLKHVDYVRFVGVLLDVTLKSEMGARSAAASGKGYQNLGKNSGTAAFPLQGNLVSVVPFEAENHVPLLQSWVDDAVGRNFLISRSSASRYPLETLIDHPGTVLGMITPAGESTPVGAVAFLNIDKPNRRAELRKIIGVPGSRRGGYAREAAQLWLDYGWRGLALHKVYLSTLQINLPNIELNRELGFSVEGVLKDEVFYDNTFHDVLRMSMFAPD